MEFDQNGKRIKNSSHRNPVIDDVTVVDLGSRHPGISDSHLAVALDSVAKDRHEEFYRILVQIKTSLDGS